MAGIKDRVPWTATDAALATGLVVGSSVALLVMLRLIAGFGNGTGQAFITPWMVGFAESSLLVAVWVFGVNKYQVGWRALGLRRTPARWALPLPGLVLLGSLVFTAVYSVLIAAVGLDQLVPAPLPDGVLGHGLTRLLNTLLIVTWVPFAEEAFFRGFILAALVVPRGGLRAALISSAIFAASHLMLGTMLPIFVTGLLFSWLYLKTRSIWPSMAAHAVQNLIAVSAMA